MGYFIVMIKSINTLDDFWHLLRTQAEQAQKSDSTLQPLFTYAILNHADVASSLAYVLAGKLSCTDMPRDALTKLIKDLYTQHPDLLNHALADLNTHIQNDPAAHYEDTLTPYLFFKGFHALQGYRLAHVLWKQSRKHMALYLQSRVSSVFGVDIHPGAQISAGIMMDHATGIVIGETAIVEENVLFWHNVTLGGKDVPGRRHPLVRRGARLGAGSTLFGAIEVGENAVVAADSTVVKDVPANALMTGLPAERK